MAIQTRADADRALALATSGRVTPEQARRLKQDALVFLRKGGEAQSAEDIQSAGPTDPNLPAISEAAIIPKAVGRGIGQRTIQIGDFLARPFRDDVEQAAIAEQRLQENAQEDVLAQEQARRSEHISPGAVDIAQIAGGIVPDIVAGGAAGLGRTITARLLANSGVETLLGASTAGADGDATAGAVIGFVLGTGISGLSEIPNGAKSFLLSSERKAYNSQTAQQSRTLSEATGIDMSVGEQSLDTTVRSTEGQLPSTPDNIRGNFLAKQTQQILSKFEDLNKALNPDNIGTEALITTSRKIFQNTASNLSKVASSNFRDALQPAVKALGGVIDKSGRIVANQPVIPVRGLRQEYLTQIQRGIDPPRKISKGEEQKLVSIVQELDKANGAGGITLARAQELASDLTESTFAGGTASQNRLTAKGQLNDRLLRDAFIDDLDAVANTEGLEGTVVQALKSARAGYAKDIEQANALNNSAVAKLFGKITDADPGTQQFTQAVARMEGKEFTQFMGLLDTAKPGFSQVLRGRMLLEFADKHAKAGAKSSLDETVKVLDIPGFMKEFNSMPFSKWKSFTGEGVKDTTMAAARNTLIAMEKIAEAGVTTREGAGKLSASGRLQAFAINIISRDPGFVGRLVSGEMSPGFFERALFTKQGLEFLAGSTPSKVGTASFTGATQGLSGLLRQDDEARAEAQEAARKQQINDRFSRPGAI